ncbi:DegT/DnrJ/EryC1/StrS family aminotransferase [Natronococcus pandeyae]|uniref:DegT/DnrJ/EryC1/StrS family aminotransferase n=1 Tax=Natronococcus pandeyae TaxID=2055836 RepID=UPI00165321E1|nr:aminotransferase class I/II-fold pyridoxal phosphate-dependent enzyme [Natronococcus pandeyae]
MIPAYEPWLGERERELVTRAVSSGWVSPVGDFIEEFERSFAEFVGTEHAIATSSGTAALHLALVAADIEMGDEVIVPDLTWIACANAVRYAGADPVFADVDPETLTLQPERVRDVVSSETAAILPVHLYGHPCQMDRLVEIAREYDALVIEDCAEAHGAEYRNRTVGSIGDVGCFSFYGNKMITTGQGGMVTTDDDELAERLRLYNRDGMSTERTYYHPVIGYNYRMSNVHAAIGVGQLGRIDEIVERKRAIANRYRDRLTSHDVTLTDERSWATSVFWMNTVMFDSPDTRDLAVDVLEADGIETRPLFYPLHRQPPYAESKRGTITVASDRYRRGLNLPSGPTLRDAEIDRICDRLATLE